VAARPKKTWLHRRLKLSHHRHTGRLLSHEHTSHGALMVITLAVGAMLVFATNSLVASADTLQSGSSLTLTGKVRLLPPSEKAVILTPKEGDVFTNAPIIISGTCQLNDFVQIYRNHKAIDALICIRGQFGTQVDLVAGKNTFTVRTLDYTFQFGPDSDHVNVTYNPKPKTGVNANLGQLLVSLEASDIATPENQSYSLNLSVEGGQAPYAINVRWGDGSQESVPVASAGNFSLKHKYSAGNIYSILISATDSLGNKATTESVVLVGGPALATTGPGGTTGTTRSVLDIVWPVYVVSLVGLTIFWLGEKYELARLHRAMKHKKT
jgi:hypothetical protein